ncbi:hypothetical protein [Sphingomonas hengshuiensis]|uniref:Uncharacterized protein n=1 Tax=Sphingomonas hengshuiensis TaxID=1609977 RepID=A0A7U4JAT1_9SPHN|nr:hypothetical protein [Sphingomonas hengshuiensis]AJP73406.1 hypothetical protein TS85_18850 [Sphingomonas hengshuiensis]
MVMTGLYLWKWLFAFSLAKAEASHQVHGCCIGLGGSAMLRMALEALPYSQPAAVTLLAVGAFCARPRTVAHEF